MISQFALPTMPPPRVTYLAAAGQRRDQRQKGREIVVLPPGGYVGADTLIDHIEFALKREGVNLDVLAALFRRVDQEIFESELAAAIVARPTGRYTRGLWFLYEYLTGSVLDVPDATTGNYVPVLDPIRYFTRAGRRSKRHRVVDNLLGNPSFCPTVRKTDELADYSAMNLAQEAADLVQQYDPESLKRAVSYLYTKETKSSFAIEGERPSTSRTERYVALLRDLPKISRLDKQQLIRLQNETVDPRFADRDYRVEQVYIGEEVDVGRQKIHFIAPKPEDVPSMMQGLLDIVPTIRDGPDPVVMAAAVSFGFVLIHPFSDGNGRLHRALIHYVLSTAGFSPEGVIFPVSAVMSQKRREYDGCLESFSVPLMERLDYDEASDGAVTVKNETATFYRFLDATVMAEYLYACVKETVRSEFRRELEFVVAFRETRRAIDQVLEMPDKEANLFIRFVLQNRGTLSQAKRLSHFHKLTDREIHQMEEIVRQQLIAAIAQQGTDDAADTVT